MTLVQNMVCPHCGSYYLPDPVRQRLQRDYEKHLESGCQDSSGIAGAPGPLTHVSETLARVLTDVSITPDDGLNTFQGQLVAISSPWSADSEGEFTLTVFFDSRTHRRLVESLYGDRGIDGTVDVGLSDMTVILAPLTT